MSSERPDAPADAIALGAALGGALHAATKASQTNTIVGGMEEMARAADHLRKKAPEFLKGDLFEYIEMAKFNAEAAATDPSLVATLTRDAGQPHAAADILIKRHNEVVREVQAKASNGTEELTGYLRDPKYHGMQKLVPSDKVDQVKARAEFRARYWQKRGDADFARENADTAENVTGELRTGTVSSGGTTTEELDFATRHPRLYRLRVETRYVAGEAVSAASRAAVTGALVGGAISVVKHTVLVARDEMDVGHAVIGTAKDAARSGARSGVTGAAGTIVRYGATRAGVTSLAKANVATAVAAGVIDIGVTLHEYAKGKLPADIAAERIGQTGCSTMSSIYAGAAAGLVFGPVGAVVGSVAGYLVAAQVYQSGLALLRRARLADGEATRIEAVCADAVEAMAVLRHEIDARVFEIIGERQRTLDECLALVDSGLDDASPHVAIEGLSRLAMTCGHTLQFASFEEFDAFMLEREPLRL